MDKVENASQMPKRYFGLHMSEGLAEYREPGADPFRILILDNALNEMNPSFEGKPFIVLHAEEEVTPEKLNQYDGYVVKSFFNEADGKHWAEFLVTTDKGHNAVAQGWTLSNAYFQKAYGPAGEWHGVPYDKEIKIGEYEHLAIVPNPRYTESVILTPEKFEEYNSSLREKNKKLLNSKKTEDNNKKEETPSMFKMFKREKIENAADLENTLVQLPESKKELTIAEGLKQLDKFLNMNGYANGDHFVKAGDEEMSVNDMAKGYCEMKEKMKNMVEKPIGDEGEEDSVDNAEDDKEKKEEDKKAENNKDKIMNADKKAKEAQPEVARTMVQNLQVGKERY